MIEAAITIQSSFPLWAIIGGGLLLLCFLIWKEWQRKIKLLAWRLAAVIFLIFSLIGLLLRPSFVSERKPDGIVLLTKNYKTLLADSLQKTDPKLTFLRTAGAKPYRGVEEISFHYDLSNYSKRLRFVLGDGLPYYSLQEIKSAFQFLNGELPTGIIEWKASTTFKPNQQAEINGVFNAKSKSKIKLISPSSSADSVVFNAQGLHSFKLSFAPTQSGLFVYSIIIQDSTGISTHKFPVEVISEKKLNILFLQIFPTAEAKYLKNFLIEKGHAVMARTQTSKNNFRYEYANRWPLRIEKISAEVIKEIDLIVIDNESLQSLTSYEKNILEESVKKGLGLLMLYNSIEKKENASSLSLATKEIKVDTIRLALGKSFYAFPTLPLKIDAENIESITQSKERILSGYVSKGAGKIAFQLMQETYRLVLEGKTMDYAQLWSPLIEQTAKVQDLRFKIELMNDFPVYTDEPMDINVIASKQNPKLISDSALLPLHEDVVIDDYWHGSTWAGKAGWHQFSISQDSTVKNYYVSNKSEWKSLRIVQQQKANEAKSNKILSNEQAEVTFIEKNLISPVFFFLLFLLSAGFLWLAPKI
ncbi:MAG: hypothetical protein ACKVOQ_18615 [Cyclobacteriaceae bacterium]